MEATPNGRGWQQASALGTAQSMALTGSVCGGGWGEGCNCPEHGSDWQCCSNAVTTQSMALIGSG